MLRLISRSFADRSAIDISEEIFNKVLRESNLMFELYLGLDEVGDGDDGKVFFVEAKVSQI